MSIDAPDYNEAKTYKGSEKELRKLIDAAIGLGVDHGAAWDLVYFAYGLGFNRATTIFTERAEG